VFWVPVTNAESMSEAYLEIGQQLQIPDVEQGQADIQKLVQRYLSQDSSGKWLLVFDNADDVDIWTKKPENTSDSSRLIDYLPRSKHGSILFTTRSRKAAVKLAGKNVVSVGEMDETAAKELLENLLMDRDLLTDDRSTTELLQRLTHLPLAIVQAAAYINENQIAISEYVTLITHTEQSFINMLSEEFEDEGRYANATNPVAATWLVSFEQIRTRDPLAADYLSFMSCVDAKNIPQSLLPPAQSIQKALEAIGTLSAYSFITKHKAGQLMDLHQLVHLVTRNWLREEEVLARWTERAIARLQEVFPNDDHKNRSVWRTYLPHARYALESNLIDKDGENRIDLAWKYGTCLYHDGRYNEAEMSFVQVMETRKRVLGAEHLDTLTSMANLASTYRNQGRWKEAEELEVQVMETRKRVLGAEHPSTLTSMNNLAFMWKELGQDAEAIKLMEICVLLRRLVLGVDHPDTLSSSEALIGWQTEKLDIGVSGVTNLD
jgi:tetratricopeptide (TPR) repeat protein